MFLSRYLVALRPFAEAAFVLFAMLASSVVGASPYGIELDSAKTCPAVNDKLGQLLLVTVDGYGKGTKEAIHPDYIKLVKLLDLGGVLPRFGKTEPRAVFSSTQQLYRATQLPLLIAAQSLKVSYTANGSNQLVTVGYGDGEGWQKHSGKQQASCLEQDAFLDAYLHQALGLNLTLGPTVLGQANPRISISDDEIAKTALQMVGNYRNLGIKTAVKYFPYPAAYLDAGERIPQPLSLFAQVATRSDFVLTGRSNDGTADAVARASAIPELLRRRLHYSGLVIADRVGRLGLKALPSAWLKRHPGDDPLAAALAQLIVDGHDMVILEGVARQTLRTFEQLSTMACRDDLDGKELQARILQAHQAIKKYKRANQGAFSYRPSVDEQLLAEVLEYKHRLDSKKQCRLSDEERFTFAHLKQQIFDLH